MSSLEIKVESLKFYPPDVPPGMNGQNGLLRMHWSERKRIKGKFTWLIHEKQFPKKPNKFRLKIINHYSNVPMDWDNLASRLKIVGDALKFAQRIKDDSPEFITELKLDQRKVKTRKESHIEFIFKFQKEMKA
jgi:hypothetical protein